MAEREMNMNFCSVREPQVHGVLKRLHREAGRQALPLARLLASFVIDKLTRHKLTMSEEVSRLKNLYVPVSRKQGEFLYSAARSIRAKRIVEFGSSFGISAIYLAAAVRDNGGGIVVGSEIEPNKVVTARRNIEQAGLGNLVEIREGDARLTLKDPGGAIDMLFLDGFKELYLPMLELLTPHLRSGAIVVADNIFTFRIALAPYLAYLRDPANGFLSTTLFLGDGTEYSLRL
jgi:predicted O-methyltransferase YrrM